MRSLLRFSLLLSLSVVDVYEKMVKVQIKIHKEPPDHKMVIKVGLSEYRSINTEKGERGGSGGSLHESVCFFVVELFLSTAVYLVMCVRPNDK